MKKHQGPWASGCQPPMYLLAAQHLITYKNPVFPLLPAALALRQTSFYWAIFGPLSYIALP